MSAARAGIRLVRTRPDEPSSHVCSRRQACSSGPSLSQSVEICAEVSHPGGGQLSLDALDMVGHGRCSGR